VRRLHRPASTPGNAAGAPPSPLMTEVHSIRHNNAPDWVTPVCLCVGWPPRWGRGHGSGILQLIAQMFHAQVEAVLSRRPLGLQESGNEPDFVRADVLRD
jgi:hypothetical protein